MSDLINADKNYVAPIEAPPSRRPPLREIGLINWMRQNLFGSPVDTIMTIITAIVIVLAVRSFLSWALLRAQWEIVFLNLRALGVGQQFPPDQVWRVELAAFIFIFISLLSVGVWGRISRNLVMGLGVIAVLMIFIPWVSQGVERPDIFTYTDVGYTDREVNFIARAGDEIVFNIQPLTDPAEFGIATLDGFVENNNQQGNTSMDAFNEATQQVNFLGTLDPSAYDLSIAVQVWNARGEVIAQSPFTEGSHEDLRFTWTAPSDAWYTYTIVKDEENPGEIGIALIRTENIEVLRSTRPARRQYLAEFGPEPVPECRTCGTSVVRTDLRFEGERTIPQWFSLQLTPYLLETRLFFFYALIAGAFGYAIGSTSRRYGLFSNEQTEGLERNLLLISAVFVVAYVAASITNSVYSWESAAQISTLLLVSFIISVLLYCLVLLLKDNPQSSSRAISILWIVSIPIVLNIISGFRGSSELPAINGDAYGGLLLTLMLSAIAIVASFPLGMILALGRASDLPMVRLICTVFIETVRGVPLITLLFIGRLILPFFGFGLGDVSLLIRISVVLTLFTSAYMAEVIRGGLQIVPQGQLEAARALGLVEFWTTNLIVLPQALRAVIPAMMGQSISLFKDTSLVYLVSLFEVLGAMTRLLGDSQTGYTAFPREGYLYIGILYFIFSYMMAEISRRIEKTGSGAVRRDTI